MGDDEILILTGSEVSELLVGRELELMERVQTAYELHAMGKTAVPHSTFLRFPNNQGSRIIALPAYLGGGVEVAGVKWVASFPDNLANGIDRASAVLILNSTRTGRPETMMEASVINAKRTAASAALAAKYLSRTSRIDRFALAGCGLINFEILRFVKRIYPQIQSLTLYDLDPQRAGLFMKKCKNTFGVQDIQIVDNVPSLLSSCSLISFATTAPVPHISDITPCNTGTTILHISLRDFTPEAVLTATNIVDDADHVCRAQTSLDLAQQLVKNRGFIRASLADVTLGKVDLGQENGLRKVTIFSPFGLGILDVAVGNYVREIALGKQKGLIVKSFFPVPWTHDQPTDVRADSHMQAK
jgi:2,3-diaminopropionate biosynthesis protein SbnB